MGPLANRTNEKFAQLVVELGSQAEAYRRACKPAASITNKSIHEMASRLANNNKVAARIKEIRDELALQMMWTKIDSVRILRNIAEQPEKQSDAVASVKALNAMFGWDRQVIEHSGTIELKSDFESLLDELNDDDDTDEADETEESYTDEE